jgi:N-acetylglucosaminyl-diphospho-decaprenol L-rhamnosyltransferase
VSPSTNPTSQPAIPIFILHWNRPEECLETVSLFLRQTDVRIELQIIDNASEWDKFVALRDRLPAEVKVIRLEENKGWGGAFNIALSHWLTTAGSDYCFISAHDAIPQDHCLKMLAETFENDPALGIVCPEYGSADLPLFSPVRGPRIVPTTARTKGTVEPVDIPHGTLIGFRRSCLQQIGCFDERYFAYGDEYDLGLRAREHQWKVAIVWGAVVLNPGSWTPSTLKNYLFTRNSLLLAKSHGGWGYATLRAVLMGINMMKLILFPWTRKNAYFCEQFFRTRSLGIRDFFMGNYGLPTSDFS